MRKRYQYLGLGALASLSIPFVAAVLLEVRHAPMGPSARLLYQWMTVEATVSFSLAAYWLGRQRETLDSERCSCRLNRTALNHLAMTDALTGLYNRRYLMEHLAQELKESDRYGKPVTCLMLDIDRFKTINDSCGHPFGDLVLAGIARAITDTVRRADAAGRYGGEEFLIVMPRLAPEEALPLAERLREAVAALPFLHKGRLVPVTVSIGLAGYRRLGSWRSAPALIEAADQALYSAKRRGRNRCVLWHDGMADQRQAEAPIGVHLTQSA